MQLGLEALGRNIVWTLGRQLLSILTGLVTVAVVARVLGPAGNGQFVVAYLLPVLLGKLLLLGMPSSVVYFVGRRAWTEIDAAQVVNLGWLLVFAVGLALGAALIQGPLPRFYADVPVPLFWWGLLALPGMLLHSFVQSIAQGLERFRIFNLLTYLPAAATLLAVATLALAGWLTPRNVLLAHAFGYLAAAAVALRSIGRGAGLGATERTFGRLREGLGYGWRAHLGNIIAFINYRMDVFMVGAMLGAAPAGIYNVAVQIAERMWLLSQSTSTVLLPRLAALHEDETTRKALTPLVSRLTLLATLFAAGVLASIAVPLVELLFGAEYGAAAPVLWLLLPGIVLVTVSRILANDVAARGRPEYNLYTALLALLVNLGGNYLLIPKFGVLGAALASSLGYLVNTVAKLFIYARLSGNPWHEPLMLRVSDVTQALDVMRALAARRRR